MKPQFSAGRSPSLDVQVPSDIALPLVHDSIVPWGLTQPNLLQRMMLAGLAIGSPKDAATLHPDWSPRPNRRGRSSILAEPNGLLPAPWTRR